jgi:hypothetical protein
MNEVRNNYQAFIIAFDELRKICGSPAEIAEESLKNNKVKDLCDKLASIKISFSMDEIYERKLFRDPVNAAFIKAWREYDNSWNGAVTDVAWAEIFEGLETNFEDSRKDRFYREWEWADEKAKHVVACMVDTVERAVDSLQIGDFNEDYVDLIENGAREFRSLRTVVGVNLHGIIRRRALTPTILIPSHVAKRHGAILGPQSSNKLSLKLQLREAQEAFIFGLPLAALSHMRAIMEILLTFHYGFQDTRLDDKIDRLRYDTQKTKLHKLRKIANDVLHSNALNKEDPHREKTLKEMGTYAALLADFDLHDIKKREVVIKIEKEMILHLINIRDLVEKAPK